MSITDIIEVSDDAFEINRKDKGDNIKTSCNYNTNKLELEMLHNSTPLDDGKCVTTYKFKIINNNTDTIIKFVEENHVYKYVFHYKYNAKDNNVRFIGFSSTRI